MTKPEPAPGSSASASLILPSAAASESTTPTAPFTDASANAVKAAVTSSTLQTPPISASATRSACSARFRRSARTTSSRPSSPLAKREALSVCLATMARCVSSGAAPASCSKPRRIFEDELPQERRMIGNRSEDAFQRILLQKPREIARVRRLRRARLEIGEPCPRPLRVRKRRRLRDSLREGPDVWDRGGVVHRACQSAAHASPGGRGQVAKRPGEGLRSSNSRLKPFGRSPHPDR